MRSRHRNIARTALLTLTTCVGGGIASGVSPSTRPAEHAFTLNGKPIHPLAVEPLVGDLASELPAVAAVDLEGSEQTGITRSTATVSGDVTSAMNGDGYVTYRLLGTTPSGLRVLVVMVNGGGSGVFQDALWVKIVHDRIWEDGKKRDRTMLVRVGQFALGDRDDGTVSLDGANLCIGKSRYREKDTIIPLE